MAAAMGYALRRTSARVVLLVGAFGLLWTVWVAQPFHGAVEMRASRLAVPRGVYRVAWSGFSSWDVAVAVSLATVAVVAAAGLPHARASGR